ncbi:hypothetical protein GCM10010387_22690 [Streptomyces inusitatus]|uniref:Uncharacterized protein n=2 Tax=Streptomyces inusitatus TaxID=68221 RepID=A0A918Q2P3_9ACTN|nr:hypothetical protein GCM10010387_22690 [Streptomyces inusitatus]
MSAPAVSISDACPCRRSCGRTRRRSPFGQVRVILEPDGVDQPTEELGDVIRGQGDAVVMGEHEPVVPVHRLPLAALFLLPQFVP